MNLFDVESVADLSFLFGDVCQLLKQSHGGSQQLGNCLGCALASPVHVIRVAEHDQVSVNEHIHFQLKEQQTNLFEDL